MAGTFLHRTIGLMAAAGIGLCPCRGRPPLRGRTALCPRFYDTEPTLPKTAAALASGQTVSSWRSAAPQRSGVRRVAPISPGQRVSPWPSPAASRPRV